MTDLPIARRKVFKCLAAGSVIGTAALVMPGAAAAAHTSTTIEVYLTDYLTTSPLTGRLFVMISRVGEPEVRLQGHWINGVQIFAVDVRDWKPGQSVRLDDRVPGFPFETLGALPAGDYFVQAVFNRYTRFDRADQRSIWAHMDQGEGQDFARSPGNLVSAVQPAMLDPGKGYGVVLQLSQSLPPLEPLPDTPWVCRFRIRSELLSRFWGQPIYLGAVVLLPKGYGCEPERHYPVIYHQTGHFSNTPPFNFNPVDRPEKPWDRRERISSGYETGYEFHQAWLGEDFPRFVAVSFQHTTPFADMSGVSNSASNGPYGDAIMTELIPEIERRYRILGAPGTRALVGKASGGRDALALQLHYPAFFGGAWVFYPWPFDFHHYFTLDIYKASNAYIIDNDDLPEWARSPSQWHGVERYLIRTAFGQPISTVRSLSRLDQLLSTYAGGEFGSDDALHGPVGDDGYPSPLWDRKTGNIDPNVVAHWREHGDLRWYAERHWQELVQHLDGKLHFYAGDMDHWERNYGVRKLEAFIQSATPRIRATFEYAPLVSDWQPMTNAELVRRIAAHMELDAKAYASSVRTACENV